MIVWTHDRWRFPLPERHRFPIEKYTLLRERVEAEGVEVRDAEPVPWAWLEAVHEPALIERIRTGALSVREERGLGLPWSPALVERGRRSVGGTVAAAGLALERGLGMNLGGGTHHAGRGFARGYCLFNDVAVALSRMRAEGRARRALIVDCDVHQGDGTADLLGGDPDCFTLSLHGARNYPFKRIPSDLDVDLESGTGDDAYLEALSEALDHADPARRGRAGLLSGRRRPVEGRPARAPGADQGGPPRARRAGARPPARDGRRGLRGARRRLRGGRARHGRHPRRDCPRCDHAFRAPSWLPMTKR